MQTKIKSKSSHHIYKEVMKFIGGRSQRIPGPRLRENQDESEKLLKSYLLGVDIQPNFKTLV